MLRKLLYSISIQVLILITTAFYKTFQIYSYIPDVNYMRVIFRFSPILILICYSFTLLTTLKYHHYFMRKYTKRASTLRMATWEIVLKGSYISPINVILYFRICCLCFMVIYYVNKTDTVATSLYTWCLPILAVFQKQWG